MTMVCIQVAIPGDLPDALVHLGPSVENQGSPDVETRKYLFIKLAPSGAHWLPPARTIRERLVKSARNARICPRDTAAKMGVLLGMAVLVGAPSSAYADACGRNGDFCQYGSVSTYRLTYSITTTPAGTAITHLTDFYAPRYVTDQGQFSIENPPTLPTGSGTLDAGFWTGADAHFLAGVLVDSAGIKHLVMGMNPATAALMVGHPFDEIVNGIPPLAQPNPFPVTNAEALIIDRITKREAEFNDDVWSLFDTLYRPNALDPTVVLDATTRNAAFTLVQFTDGQIIGSAAIDVTPVPEPASWLVMLAGIGLLGLRCRMGREARGG